MKSYMTFLCLALLLAISTCGAFATTIHEAKTLEDTSPVTLSGEVVTYASANFFYVEEEENYMGIRVEKAAHGLTVGMKADVIGSMATKTDTRERYIQASSAVQTAPPNDTGAVPPAAMGNRALGGEDWMVSGTGGQRGITGSFGLNNVGLLVTIWGRFEQVDDTTFTVDDGSALNIRCTVPSGTFLSDTWQYVFVTGVVSIYCPEASVYAPLLLVRGVNVLTPTEALSVPGAPTGDTGPLLNLGYTYHTTGATCTQGHPVEYSYNWGDGTPSSSWSLSKSCAHAWTTTGAKTVTVSARCQMNHSLTQTSTGLVVTPVTQLASDPWPMFRHDNRHTGVSPYHDPAPYGSVWTRSTGNGLSSPTVGKDGTIYVGGNTYLYALNRDGTVKWTRTINGSTRSTPAIASNGTIYIGGADNYVYSISSSGSQNWRYATGGVVSSSPVVGSDGVIYVGSRDGYLYALNSGGTRKWRYQTGDIHMCSPILGSDNTVYCTGGSSLWAINTSNGSLKWNYSLGAGTTSSPAMSPDGSRIYVGCYDGNLYCVDSAGSLVWNVQVGFKSGSTCSSPAVGPDGTIYIGSNYGSVYAIQPDGTEKWIFETRSDVRSSVAISADGTIYVSAYDGYVYALNPNGTEKWHFLTTSTNYASPAIASDGSVITCAMNGVVFGNLRNTPATATPPTGLVAVLATDTSAQLTWTDNSSDEYGFRIERRMGTTGVFTRITNVGAGVTTYTDSELQSGRVYYYRVCAYQSGGDSAYTNEAHVTTPGIQTPDGLIATPVAAQQIDLTWTDMSNDELGFYIERSEGPNGLFRVIAQVGMDVTTYTDTYVYPATNYYYRVRAFDATRLSSYSNEDWALTPGKDLGNITRGNTSRNQIALTFDAGTAAIRSGLLDTLKTNNVFCTMFITGYVTQVQSSLVNRIGSDGHHVCNHTYDHPDLRFCTDEYIEWQLEVTDGIIRDASAHHTKSFFRSPYGAYNQHVIDVAAGIGFRHVAWTVGTNDAEGATTQQIIDAATKGAGNGAIILCHCTVANTEAAVPTIISNLRGMGYELVTVPEVVAPTQVSSPAGQINAGWNLISLPIVPALEFPHIVFRGVTIDTNLKRWDVATSSEVTYNAASPGAFGNMNADEGYWLYQSAPATVKFNGAAAATDRRIRLPQTTNPAQYALIGYPFETAQDFANLMVYNPNAAEPKTRSIRDAIAAGWMPDRFYGWDSVTQTEFSVSVPEYSPTRTQLQPWYGYRAAALVPGIELIIPKP